MNSRIFKSGDYQDINRLGRTSTKKVAGSSVGSLLSYLSTQTDTLSHLSLFSLEELKGNYERFAEDLKMFNVENYLLEKYLMQVRPTIERDVKYSMDSADQITKRVTKLAQKISPTMNISDSSMVGFDKRKNTGSVNASIGGRSLRKGQFSTLMHSKLSLDFRSDLATRERDDIENRMQELQKKCAKSKLSLKTDIEERVTARRELDNTRETIQDIFINTETATGRSLSAEKYLKTINDLLKADEQEIRKMTLRISTLRRSYSHMKVKLTDARELGETIGPVDFDELKIENNNYALTLENKNKYLIELKRITGVSTINSNVKKRCLDDLKATIHDYNEQIKSKQKLIKKHTSEIIKTVSEVGKARRENKSIKNVVKKFTAPSVMDYAKLKLNLRTLQKDLKMWSRRVHLQDITIKLLKERLRSKNEIMYKYYKFKNSIKKIQPLINQDCKFKHHFPNDGNSRCKMNVNT